MTPSLLPRLATGEVSRDLDAAICVALQYVPGVPDAKKVRIDGTFGSEPMLFFQDILGTEFRPIPPLTSDLNAVVAAVRAKAPEYAFLSFRQYGKDYYEASFEKQLSILSWRPLSDAYSRTMCGAIAGALLKLVDEPYTHAIFSADFHIANAFEERDLAYIVAAHPTAILALLDQHAAEIAAKDARIKELEGDVDRLEAALKSAREACVSDFNCEEEMHAEALRLQSTNLHPAFAVDVQEHRNAAFQNGWDDGYAEGFGKANLNAERSLAEANARIEELEEERDAANDRTVKMIETVQRMRRAGEDLAATLRAALAGTDTPEKAGA